MQVLLSAHEIHEAVKRLAGELNRRYEDRPVLIIGIATGCIVFLSDLIRLLKMPVHIELIRAHSYHGDATRPGELMLDLWGLQESDVAGRNVLVLDDIFDTGRTLRRVTETIRDLHADEVRSVVLLEKPDRREVDFTPDYVALRIPDEFVVGYGLDFDGRYRNLPYIAAMDGEAMPVQAVGNKKASAESKGDWREKLCRARQQVSSLCAGSASSVALQSVCSQLDYLIALEDRVETDESRLKDIIVGRLAVYELSGVLSHELSVLLCEISDNIRRRVRRRGCAD